MGTFPVSHIFKLVPFIFFSLIFLIVQTNAQLHNCTVDMIRYSRL